MDRYPRNISYGLTGVVASLRVKNLGFLSVDIHKLLVVVIVHGIILDRGMVRALMTVQEWW